VTAEEAFQNRKSKVSVRAEGKVVRTLTDDHEGIHHQRFIIQGRTGQTVLVAHNLERAYRAPVIIGDKVEIHGSYAWNKQGGIIHNTHHDDREACNRMENGRVVCGKQHDDGWIVFVGKKDPHRTKNSPTEGFVKS
jgi:hypothetical protein